MIGWAQDPQLQDVGCLAWSSMRIMGDGAQSLGVLCCLNMMLELSGTRYGHQRVHRVRKGEQCDLMTGSVELEKPDSVDDIDMKRADVRLTCYSCRTKCMISLR